MREEDFADIVLKRIIAGEMNLSAVRGGTPAQVDMVIRVAKRLLRSQDPVQQMWGRHLSFAIGTCYARSLVQFLDTMGVK